MIAASSNSPDTAPIAAKVAACVVALVFAAAASIAGAEVRLETDTDTATAGYYQLSWAESNIRSRLVESRDPEFRDKLVVYAGADTARLMSGKPDGDYYYRLEANDATAAPVSNSLKVTVQHHSLQRAWTFFAVGAAVFAATLGLIVFGSRAAGGSDE